MPVRAGFAQDAQSSPARQASAAPGRPVSAARPIRLWLRAEAGGHALACDQMRQALAKLCPTGVLIETSPNMAGQMAGIDTWLDMARPDVILSLSALPPRPLLDAATSRRVPMVLADADVTSWPRPRLWQRLLAARPMAQLAHVLVPDQSARMESIRRGALPDTVTVTGALTETRTPLPCNESELAALAHALGGRQGWYAVALPMAEETAVIHAHHAVLGLSHRALLLAQPADPRRAPALAEQCEAAGLHTGLRSDAGEPDADHQVFILDDPQELGLWYRLAPVTLIGGTISGKDAATRHPFEAAALGSAILHGPELHRHTEAWHQLRRAGASRLVPQGDALADHLLTALEPEQAAELASRAWNISTGGAVVAAKIAQITIDTALSGLRMRAN